FGVNSTSYIPVYFTPTYGLGGEVSISTRATAALDNLPEAAGTSSARPIVAGIHEYNFSSADAIDRWWKISATGFKADVTLSYLGTENTLAAGNNHGNIGILQWNGNNWNEPVGNGNGVVSGTGTVSASDVTEFSDWLLVAHSNPLPIVLTSFTGKVKGKEVYLSWT